jgi:hypothetical protein
VGDGRDLEILLELELRLKFEMELALGPPERKEGSRRVFVRCKTHCKNCGPIFFCSTPHQNLAHSVFGI